jgi:hypothetical protein
VEEKTDRQMNSCIEKCLGKFSDSYEIALDVFGDNLVTMNQKRVFTHSLDD